MWVASHAKEKERSQEFPANMHLQAHSCAGQCAAQIVCAPCTEYGVCNFPVDEPAPFRSPASVREALYSCNPSALSRF